MDKYIYWSDPHLAGPPAALQSLRSLRAAGGKITAKLVMKEEKEGLKSWETSLNFALELSNRTRPHHIPDVSDARKCLSDRGHSKGNSVMRQPLKSLHEVMEQDKRHGYFAVMDPETGEGRPFTLEYLHNRIQAIQLIEAVPTEVREQFDIVLNLLLYSWFVYDFSSSALMLANATVEMALNLKCEKETGGKSRRRPGLKKLLQQAVKSGWIVDGDFSHLDETKYSPNGTKYCKSLPRVLPDLRNSLAHGSSFLSPPVAVVGMVDINAHVINALFKHAPKVTR